MSDNICDNVRIYRKEGGNQHGEIWETVSRKVGGEQLFGYHKTIQKLLESIAEIMKSLKTVQRLELQSI